MGRTGVVLGLSAVLTMTSAGVAAVFSEQTLDQRFRIEYQVTPDQSKPVLDGYVYNVYSGLSAAHMQLAIDRLDASGNVIGTSTTWVLGEVPPNNRAYFTTRVEPAASYRVRILSFDWIGRTGGV
jgi:hypothetical protein